MRDRDITIMWSHVRRVRVVRSAHTRCVCGAFRARRRAMPDPVRLRRFAYAFDTLWSDGSHTTEHVVATGYRGAARLADTCGTLQHEAEDLRARLGRALVALDEATRGR